MSRTGGSFSTAISHPIQPSTEHHPVFVCLCRRVLGARVDWAIKYEVVRCTKRGNEFEYELYGDVNGQMRKFKVDTRYYSFYSAGR